MKLRQQIEAFLPQNEQEERDKQELLRWLDSGVDIYSRRCNTAHLTASAWVVSPDRQRVLMIYHNIYRSWAWMGGHADGIEDLHAVAEKEVREECGLTHLKALSPDIFSLEILTVDGHEKRGQYVSSHLHLNVTYLFEADPGEQVFIKPDENSGVGWFSVGEVPERVSEAWMNQRIYSKLMAKVRRDYPGNKE